MREIRGRDILIMDNILKNNLAKKIESIIFNYYQFIT